MIANQTYCVQHCIFGLEQPENDANGQNIICLSTAVFGAFFLLSGLNDMKRLATCRSQFSRFSTIDFSNCCIETIGLIKVAAGICFICNAFLYDPYKWNTNLLESCQKTCQDLINHQFFTPNPTWDPSHYAPQNPCCWLCRHDLKLPSSHDNDGLSLGWGITLAITGLVKTGASLARYIQPLINRLCKPRTVLNAAAREYKQIKSNFIHTFLELGAAIAVIVIIYSNILGNDNSIFDVSSSGLYSFSSSDGIEERCIDFCNLFSPYVKYDYC